jgi:hypothetical protein
LGEVASICQDGAGDKLKPIENDKGDSSFAAKNSIAIA